ncbi:stage II sporulation protein P [Desulfolucanica intricata]|uniref:stage II sporulation protein P n=1 Tax=Desulfolucanica intricata TaxID=1285191 RepID=UPI00082B8B86|nr:stage II sporulation protein P [Desulfolucanica intricata]
MNYRGRHRLKRNKSGRRLLFLLVIVLITGIGFSVFPYFQNGMDRLTAWFIRDPERLMRTAMPIVSVVETTKVQASARNFTGSMPKLPGIDLRGPRFILESGFPLLSQVKPPETIQVSSPLSNEDKPEQKKAVTLTKDCLVAMYNTHTGETYALTDGVDRLDGKHGGVVEVARALKKALEEKKGIRTAYSDRINDVVYNDSYIESKKTAQELIAANPNLKVVLDIHRDSEKPREQSVVEINGNKAARILIVVGSDARAPFPNWKENHAFACRVSEKMEELYPGLSLGVRVKAGRFNQYLHPRSIILEVGSTNNTTPEAVYSAELFADVLSEIISEDNSAA